MPNPYPTIVHEWFGEVWNQRNTAAIDRLLSEAAVLHGIRDDQGRELRGPRAFRDFQKHFLDAFPDIHIQVADVISEGDKFAARCIVRGRHQGDGLGMKPTQREMEFTGMCIARVEGGRIVEAWNNFDLLTMHTQLGTLGDLCQALASSSPTTA